VVNEAPIFYVGDYVTGQLKQRIRFAPSGVGTDACSDAAGDVFITAAHGYTGSLQGQIFEYQHGEKDPIETLDTGSAAPSRCSVDPTTGDLAATIASPSSQYVAVYPPGTSSPVTYSDPSISNYLGIAYDDQGNLFIIGWLAGESSTIELAELARGSSTFLNITLDKQIDGNRLQWDGTYLAVTSPANNKTQSVKVYRISVSGSSGTVVSTVTFFRASGFLSGAASLISLNRIILTSHRGEMNIYKYPAGGHILRQIRSLSGYRKAGLALSR
jgi:hypothetical protein